MRSLVLGAGGMLGRALGNELRARDWPHLALGRSELDVRDEAAIRRAARDFAPDVFFNCAALTDVDGCESRVEEAFEINGRAVEGLARVAAEQGCRLVHVSTDYVFDGEGREPYREDAPTGPRSVYGRSKLEGERHALDREGSLVVRTSWVFGVGSRNFVDTIAGRVRDGVARLDIVDDQTGRPTYAPFLARALCDLCVGGADGLIHFGNREPVTWFELGRAVVAELGAATEVRPVASDAVPRPAPRPAYSVLDVARAEAELGRRVEPWSEGVARHLRRPVDGA